MTGFVRKLSGKNAPINILGSFICFYEINTRSRPDLSRFDFPVQIRVNTRQREVRS